MSSEPRSSGADWRLGNAEHRHAEYPRSFFIPGRRERKRLSAGDDVRLLFELTDPPEDGPSAERMWIEIVERKRPGYVGVLKNQPVAIADLAAGDHVRFGPEHVIAVDNPRWHPFEDELAFVSARLLDHDGLDPGFLRHSVEGAGKEQAGTDNLTSGWELYVGDETDDELADADNIRLPNLAWLMERYPAFGDLVFSGAQDGEWALVAGEYERLDDA